MARQIRESAQAQARAKYSKAAILSSRGAFVAPRTLMGSKASHSLKAAGAAARYGHTRKGTARLVGPSKGLWRVISALYRSGKDRSRANSKRRKLKAANNNKQRQTVSLRQACAVSLRQARTVANTVHAAEMGLQTPGSSKDRELARQGKGEELARQGKRYKQRVAGKHRERLATSKRYKHAVTGESTELAAAGKGEELARQSKGKEQRARVSLTNSASPVSISKPRGIRPLNITAFPIGEPGNREARMISQAYVTDRLSLSVRSGPADTDTDHDQGADTDTYPDQAVIRIRIMIKPRYGCESRSGKKFP